MYWWIENISKWVRLLYDSCSLGPKAKTHWLKAVVDIGIEARCAWRGIGDRDAGFEHADVARRHRRHDLEKYLGSLEWSSVSHLDISMAWGGLICEKSFL